MDVFPRTNRIINLVIIMLPIKLGEMIRSGIHAQPTIRLFSFRLPIVCTTRQPETRSARWMNINIARRLSSLKTSEASFSEAKTTFKTVFRLPLACGQDNISATSTPFPLAACPHSQSLESTRRFDSPNLSPCCRQAKTRASGGQTARNTAPPCLSNSGTHWIL